MKLSIHRGRRLPPPADPAAGSRLGPTRLGRAAALAHGDPVWTPTPPFIRERLTSIRRASGHLEKILPHCPPKCRTKGLEELLRTAAAALNNGVPSELPFLPHANGGPVRLRVAAVMREWLLTSRYPRRREHLRRFLRAYQQVVPLTPVEVKLLPLALQLAVVEKCQLLPSTKESTHLELLPNLMGDLTQTCRFIRRTDWEKFGSEFARGANLGSREPARSSRPAPQDSPLPILRAHG